MGGALASDGNQQNRVFINTNLSIAAGCIGAAFTARLFYGKLEMTIIMNATLAGGVAIGTCSDIITSPAGACGSVSSPVSSLLSDLRKFHHTLQVKSTYKTHVVLDPSTVCQDSWVESLVYSPLLASQVTSMKTTSQPWLEEQKQIKFLLKF